MISAVSANPPASLRQSEPRPQALAAPPFLPAAAPPPPALLMRGLQRAQAHGRAAASPGATGRPSNPYGDGFAGRLLGQTWGSHAALSKHALIGQLKGPASAAPYGQLLRDKLAFYSALEELLAQHSNDPLVGALLHIPHLARTARLRADLAAMQAPGQASMNARDYVQYLQGLAAERPAGLAVHAWLNYLAEMFGGQGLQRVLLEPHGAAAVTSFGFATSVPELMQQTLACLDTVVRAEDEAALIAEAHIAYGWSKRLFDAAAQ